jgi:hypothetical protein
MIVDCMEEAAKMNAAENYKGWIRHSQKYFSKYFDMERI